MEEVDKIIFQSLSSAGCELDQDVKSIGQLDQEMFIDAVAKLLNTINPNETLPSKLPPNTGVRFRICSKFANVCQQLGYKTEIGYQTFLYPNEIEMRRLLIFLAEKLNKEISAMALSDQSSQLNNTKVQSLNIQIAQQLGKLLKDIWIPPYLKMNGLREQEDGKYSIEGCKFVNNYQTTTVDVPYNFMNSKEKFSDDQREYYEKYCKFVNRQTTKDSVDVLVSLLKHNTLKRLNEQQISKKKSDESKKALDEIKAFIKKDISNADLINSSFNDNSGKNVLSKSDINEIEMNIQSNNSKNPFTKGSRFTHSEKLQFTKLNEDKVVSVSNSEEQDKEEIDSLKANFQKLNQIYDEHEADLNKLHNIIVQIEQDILEQTDSNKKIEESISIKNKMVNLINEAPKNIAKLKEDINNFDAKMLNLKTQWETHKDPLELEKSKLSQRINNRKAQIDAKVEEIKSIRSQIDELNSELSLKENLVKELTSELEKNSKNSSKNSSRQFYTKRIMEIVANIDKQRKEINKILVETKSIQKEINQSTGKLERIFNSTDEKLFKDAKKDETNKKVYKLFININNSYEQLIKTIEDSSHINREIRDLEDQINSEMQDKISDKLDMVMNDYKHMKDENDAITNKIKSDRN